VGAGYGFALEHSSGWAGTPWEFATLRWFHGQQLPHWLDQVMLYFPYVGTNLTILPIVMLLALWLWRRSNKVLTAIHLLVVCLGSLSLNPTMKYLLDRPRPALFPLRGLYSWASYPSGHAILTVALYFTLALQLRFALRWRWPFAVAVTMVLITCYSRLYLAVHWPTDVIGGLLIGVVWLAGTWWAFTRYHRAVAAGISEI
jgi:membrane-associated phospholipid phosphatase